MAGYVVSHSEITSIADAIRTKGGTSAQLTFPTEFVSAIQNIPSGGNDRLKLLHTESIGVVSTTSTTAQSLNKSVVVKGVNDYDLVVVIASNNSQSVSHHLATVGVIYTSGSGSIGTKNGVVNNTPKLNIMKDSGGTVISKAGTTAYGVYTNSVTLALADDGTMTLPMYARYNSTHTLTIDGSYTVNVYGVNIANILGL